MRLSTGACLAAALVLGPCAFADLAFAHVQPPPEGEEAAGDNRDSAGEPGSSWWAKNFTGVKVRPRRPRQDSDVRVLVRCPSEATDAIVLSKVFNPPGARRFRSPLGIGLDEGRGFDTKYVAYDARRGPRRVQLKCLKVDVEDFTRHRTVDLISRAHTHVFVRKFRKGRF
ncbi:hypothetical protein HII36_40900 [Nonomuraea sp. NN258]|uniref:hypothetical protein n=1 Tax=Nonomuraea antri TaxID=2730852 RepID=UPI00156A69BA|nr:hypothetical protein [Nonomuraea antri]NRQ38145.1 hypothetical protein [Nonomuraea antri]